MRDEEIDKIIRDAAGQHHPPYDDSAWGKMEMLLDKSMPQKKDRKKPVLFLLAFLLLSSAAFFAVKTYRQANPAKLVENKNTSSQPLPATKDLTSSNNNTVSTTVETGSDKGRSATTLPGQEKQPATVIKTGNTALANTGTITTGEANDKLYKPKKKSSSQKGRLTIKIKNASSTSEDDNIEKELLVKKGNDNKEVITIEDSTETTLTENKDGKINSITNKEDVVTAQRQDSGVANIKPLQAKQNNEKDTATTTAKQKDDKLFLSKLAITLSAGKEISFIDIKNAKKLKPIYGAGLSYEANKHLTISSGLYISDKNYYAAPEQYKFPAGSTASRYLSKIDAACKVYEIPLTVYYNFKQVKNHGWFAGAGFSSFLMKKEDYDYSYLYPGGQTYTYAHSVDNENKHYFSVLNLSAGYQYKLSNSLSLKAEPYLKIPLAGVGAGKVKLNSAGILVTGSFKPFAKRK